MCEVQIEEDETFKSFLNKTKTNMMFSEYNSKDAKYTETEF
ncbi:MAG: hypothetical protein RBQ97_06520 [Acholeplasma sp.]|nr:hypothetical protein [Acholeplasma sp.]